MDRSQGEALQRAMIGLAAGERSQFRPVFDALWPMMQRFCERTLRDVDRGKDAAQAAMMKLFLHASEFDPGRDAISWALGFAAFECLSARKGSVRRREERDEELLTTLQAGGPTPEDAAIARDLRNAAMAALEDLRPADLAVIEAALRGHPSKPTGTPAAARKRLQRALERLRLIWRSRHGID